MTERRAKQVIVMRKDLNMRKSKMIAQGAHGSMKVLLDAGTPDRSGFALGTFAHAVRTPGVRPLNAATTARFAQRATRPLPAR